MKIAVITALCTLFGFVASISAEQPNILIILTDDMCYNSLGHTGSPFPDSTPRIDSILSGGTFCPQGYVTHAVCAPSRAGLMTGRYQARFGYETWTGGDKDAEKYDYGVDTREIMLPKLLKQAGYQTAFLGKWHMGVNDKFQPQNRDFDYTYGFAGRCRHLNCADPKAPLLENGKPVKVPEEAYLPELMADAATAFIERNHEKGDQPFFMYFATFSVHGPFQVTDKYIEDGAPVYTGMMRALDQAVGRVLDAIDKTGERDNTLIFYLNDNGGQAHKHEKHGYRNGIFKGEKKDYTEGGIRVPYAIQWPAELKGGKPFDHPVSSLDILPTAVAAAGAKLPEDREYDGYNLLPFLKGEAKPDTLDNRSLFWRVSYAHAVRHGDYKLYWPANTKKQKAYYESQDMTALDQRGVAPGNEYYTLRHEHPELYLEPELYNLKDDPSESKNLAASQPERVAQLSKLLDGFDELKEQEQYKAK